MRRPYRVVSRVLGPRTKVVRVTAMPTPSVSTIPDMPPAMITEQVAAPASQDVSLSVHTNADETMSGSDLPLPLPLQLPSPPSPTKTNMAVDPSFPVAVSFVAGENHGQDDDQQDAAPASPSSSSSPHTLDDARTSITVITSPPLPGNPVPVSSSFMPGLQPLAISISQDTKDQQQKWYVGDDLHAYTAHLAKQLPAILPSLYEKYGESIPLTQFFSTLRDILVYYNNDPEIRKALSNIGQYYKNGRLLNPELPGLDCSVVLVAIWKLLREFDDESLYRHFRQTLQNIGTTCLAGVTDRLLADYLALTGN